MAQSRGWQVGLTLIQCMTYRLEKQIDCDITFVFPHSKKQKVMAHKYMMTSRSPVFEAMFSGSFQESTKGVEIVDTHPETFMEMLRYIYTDDLSMTPENVIDLLQIARKYMLDGLHKKCTSFLKDNMNESNVCTILGDSLANREQTIADQCLEYISPIIDKIISTHNFSALSHEALLAILRSDEIHVTSELKLFEACIEWATKNSDDAAAQSIDGVELRQLLGPCLKQIRLWDIPPPDFANILSKVPGLLTSDEIAHIFGYMHSKNDYNKENLLQSNFNLTKRKVFATFSRFNKNIVQNGYHYGHNETIDFEIDNPAKLHGIGIFGGNENEAIDVNLTLLEKTYPYYSSKEKELLCDDFQITSSKSSIIFDSPLNILPDRRYRLIMALSNYPAYFGTNGKTQIQSRTCILTLYGSMSDDVYLYDIHMRSRWDQCDPPGDIGTGLIAEFYIS